MVHTIINYYVYLQGYLVEVAVGGRLPDPPNVGGTGGGSEVL